MSKQSLFDKLVHSRSLAIVATVLIFGALIGFPYMNSITGAQVVNTRDCRTQGCGILQNCESGDHDGNPATPETFACVSTFNFQIFTNPCAGVSCPANQACDQGVCDWDCEPSKVGCAGTTPDAVTCNDQKTRTPILKTCTANQFCDVSAISGSVDCITPAIHIFVPGVQVMPVAQVNGQSRVRDTNGRLSLTTEDINKIQDPQVGATFVGWMTNLCGPDCDLELDFVIPSASSITMQLSGLQAEASSDEMKYALRTSNVNPGTLPSHNVRIPIPQDVHDAAQTGGTVDFYVCPDAQSIVEVSPNCPGVFTYDIAPALRDSSELILGELQPGNSAQPYDVELSQLRQNSRQAVLIKDVSGTGFGFVAQRAVASVPTPVPTSNPDPCVGQDCAVCNARLGLANVINPTQVCNQGFAQNALFEREPQSTQPLADCNQDSRDFDIEQNEGAFGSYDTTNHILICKIPCRNSQGQVNQWAVAMRHCYNRDEVSFTERYNIDAEQVCDISCSTDADCNGPNLFCNSASGNCEIVSNTCSTTTSTTASNPILNPVSDTSEESTPVSGSSVPGPTPTDTAATTSESCVSVYDLNCDGLVTIDDEALLTQAVLGNTVCSRCDVTNNGDIDAEDVAHFLANAPVDGDGDGHPRQTDCDDGNPSIHPGAPESPVSIVDMNCDGIPQQATAAAGVACGSDRCSPDRTAVEVCNPSAGYQPNPCGVEKICNLGACRERSLIDIDNDGFTADVDCNELNVLINPDAIELPNDGIDNDCDGNVDETNCVEDTHMCLDAQTLGKCVNGDFEAQETCSSGCASGQCVADRVGDPAVDLIGRSYEGTCPDKIDVCSGVELWTCSQSGAEYSWTKQNCELDGEVCVADPLGDSCQVQISQEAGNCGDPECEHNGQFATGEFCVKANPAAEDADIFVSCVQDATGCMVVDTARTNDCSVKEPAQSCKAYAGDGCVECVEDSDCERNVGNNLCNLETNTCVECNYDTDCQIKGLGAVCDRQSQRCEACRICEPGERVCASSGEIQECEVIPFGEPGSGVWDSSTNSFKECTRFKPPQRCGNRFLFGGAQCEASGNAVFVEQCTFTINGDQPEVDCDFANIGRNNLQEELGTKFYFVQACDPQCVGTNCPAGFSCGFYTTEHDVRTAAGAQTFCGETNFFGVTKCKGNTLIPFMIGENWKILQEPGAKCRCFFDFNCGDGETCQNGYCYEGTVTDGSGDYQLVPSHQLYNNGYSFFHQNAQSQMEPWSLGEPLVSGARMAINRPEGGRFLEFTLPANNGQRQLVNLANLRFEQGDAGVAVSNFGNAGLKDLKLFLYDNSPVVYVCTGAAVLADVGAGCPGQRLQFFREKIINDHGGEQTINPPGFGAVTVKAYSNHYEITIAEPSKFTTYNSVFAGEQIEVPTGGESS